MKKKIILAIVAAVCLLTLGVGSTLAYFASATGPVVNTFTVGEVDIELAETTGGTYRMIPGATVAKDPVVTVVGGSESCYLYIKLEWNGGLEKYVDYELDSGWQILGGIAGVYYREVEHSAVNKKYHVFQNDELIVKESLTKEKIEAIGDADCGLTVTAYAIQTVGIESPSDGWYNLLTELER